MFKKNVLIVLICSLILSSCKSQSISNDTYFDIVRPLFTGEKAFETTAYVEQFWRIPGNTGFNNSIHRIIENLEAAGYINEDKVNENTRLVYRLETRPMEGPTWEPVNAELSIVGNSQPLLKFDSNRNMIFQYSASTPIKGVVADVIHIESLDDFKTKDVGG